MNRPKLSPAAIRAILRRHEAGEGYRVIAHRFGVHWLTVKYHIRRAEDRMPRQLDPQFSLPLTVRLSPRDWIGVNGSTRRAAEARQLARCEAILAREPRGPGDRPTCFVCGGPCATSELGHAACTGRKVA